MSLSLAGNRLFQRLLSTKSNVCNSLRTIISPSFPCTSEWNNRLQSESLTKINSGDHFRQLKRVCDSNAYVTAIDMDILSNKLQDINPLSLDVVGNMFYKFRHSNGSVDSLPSTSYALFRTLMDLEEHEEILCLLEDKSNYGLFLDHHTAIMLLDHFIEEKYYGNAAKVVYDLMLQEDLEEPIVKALSLYACQMFLNTTPELQIEAPPTMSAELEVVYRKVAYISNPWYDDHFDMYSTNQKLGKSLIMLTSGSDDVVSRGLHFIGNILYLKFDKAMSLLTSWADSLESSVISEEHIDLAEKFLNSIEATNHLEVPEERGQVRLGHLLPFVKEEQKAQYIDQFMALKERLSAEGKIVKDVNAEAQLKDVVDKSLAENEEAFIEKQKKIFVDWNAKRDSILREHVQKLADKKKRNDLAQRIVDLKNKEEKLRYFEEKINIDLVLENRPLYPEIKDIVVEEQYVAGPAERRKEEKKKKKK